MSRRNVALLLILFTATAAVWVILAGTLSPKSAVSTASSYYSGPAGLKALYLALEELGFPVSRFRKPFSRLGDQKGILIVAHPERAPFTKREIGFLEQWIKKGGRVIVFEGKPKESYERWLEQSSKDKNTEGFEINTLRKLTESFDLKIRDFHNDTRKNLAARLLRPDLSLEINVSSDFRWKKPPGEWSWKEIVSDETGPIVVSRKYEQGSIVAISDATVPSNSEISRAQNLQFVLALLIPDRPDKIIFDEYHHGHTIEDSFWRYFGSSVFAILLLQSAIGSAIFFYSKRASYTGRFKSLAVSKGRSSLEYVDSMANIFQSCEARSVALEPILNRFLSQFAQKTGIPLKFLKEDFPNTLTAHEMATKHHLLGLIEESQNIINFPADSAKALSLARRLAILRKEWTLSGEKRLKR